MTQSGRGPPIDLAQGTASKSSLWLFVGLTDVIISISPTPAALAERSSLRLGSLYPWLRLSALLLWLASRYLPLVRFLA